MFMAILHYAYLVLKMAGPRGIISNRGDVKQAYDCDKESNEMADRLVASTELHDLKEALAESPPPRPYHARFQEIHPAERRTWQTDLIVYGGTFQGCSHRQHLGSQIGTHAHQIPLGKSGHLRMEAY
jgi:hypothetical protein